MIKHARIRHLNLKYHVLYVDTCNRYCYTASKNKLISICDNLNLDDSEEINDLEMRIVCEKCKNK